MEPGHQDLFTLSLQSLPTSRNVARRSDVHSVYNCHLNYKSSAVAEMGDRGHNRHRNKRGGGVLCPFRGALGIRLIQCGLRGGLLLYQVASSSIQPFGHNSVGCHSLRMNISTNYYFVVKMLTVTVPYAQMMRGIF